MDERPPIQAVYPEKVDAPAELSGYDIDMIYAGLLIPNDKAILSMAREIRKWRGVENPDLI